MFHPKPYLSFSQMTTFEMSPQDYIAQYVDKERRRPTKNMRYGSRMATGLEKGEASGDPILDLMMAKVPKFEIRDQPVEVTPGFEVWYERDNRNVSLPVLDNGGKGGLIPLMAVPDTMKADLSSFKEYKTSVRKWTQRMADQSGQITFYTTVMWLITHRVPEDIELVNVPVSYGEGGKLMPTGELVRWPTKRTMVDVIRMTKRIRETWQGISALCEKELL